MVRYTDADFPQLLSELAASSSLFDPVIEERTRAILEQVQTQGDAALLELTERFDGAKLTAEQLPVTQAEIMTASLKADESLRGAVAEAEKNIATFAKKSRRKAWHMRNSRPVVSSRRTVHSQLTFQARTKLRMKRHKTS